MLHRVTNICISVVLRVFCSIEAATSISYRSYYYHSRRGSSVASTLDAVRGKTVQGDRQVYHTITDVRSTIIVLLQFAIPTGVGSLELTAKSVRPKEKSFIRPISQIANEVGSSNPRMTSEVRKCPKIWFFALFGLMQVEW